MDDPMKAFRLALLLLLWPILLFGANGKTVAIGHFSNMPPGTAILGWQPLTFDKIPVHTRYALVAKGAFILGTGMMMAFKGRRLASEWKETGLNYLRMRRARRGFSDGFHPGM